MTEQEEMISLADELSKALDQMPAVNQNALLVRIYHALRSTDRTGPDVTGFDAALAAYNDAWNNWNELDASNVNECREAALRAAIAALPAPAGESVTVDAWQKNELYWAVGRWNAEVLLRPLQNIHRRALDTTWRQVIRHFGGDDEQLCGPRHDQLVEEQTRKSEAKS